MYAMLQSTSAWKAGRLSGPLQKSADCLAAQLLRKTANHSCGNLQLGRPCLGLQRGHIDSVAI
jgi:hypothetical protein